MIKNKETKTVIVDGIKHKHTSVVCINIYHSIDYKEYHYEEPVLYLQCRRKMHNKNQEKVTEIVYPLSKVTYMN